MPSSEHEIIVKGSLEDVWSIISDLDKFAPMMPGYTSHEVLNEKEAYWEFLGDFGIVKKKIKLKVDDIVRTAPDSISFILESKEENVKGEGKFSVETMDGESVKLIGYLDMTGGGFMGTMVNGVLKNYVPDAIRQMVEGIGAKAASSPAGRQ